MKKDICPKCEGTGWILETDSKGKSVAKRCSCYTENKVKNLLKQANLPKRYENCSFENFETHNPSHKNAVKISKKFVKNYPVQSIGLLFQGPCGVGKTHLAVAIINELIKNKSTPCYFCDFRDLIRNIQKSYSSESSMTESELIAPIFANNVLVLDELGAKRTSPWVEETIFYIINHRYNHKKLTLFTSNYLDRGEEDEDKRIPYFKKGNSYHKQEDSLVDRIGVRLRSRIYEMCKLVTIEGEDYRKKVKQAGYRF
jgi:DNA replication protein DnaC